MRDLHCGTAVSRDRPRPFSTGRQPRRACLITRPPTRAPGGCARLQAKVLPQDRRVAGFDYRIGDDATGRGPHNTIVVAADVVSKAHARIAFDPAATAWFVEDLDSTNGTLPDSGVPLAIAS